MDIENKVVRFASETDTAADLKRRFADVLRSVLELSCEANEHGIQVGLNFTRDQFGKLQIEAKLIKEL